MRFTRKPGPSFTTTGSLPSLRESVVMAATVSSDVLLPRTTSTSGIFSTGLKKCMPTTLSGRFDAFASSVMERDEVFDAKMACSFGACLEIPEHGFLDLHVLDHGFDGHVHFAEAAVVQCAPVIRSKPSRAWIGVRMPFFLRFWKISQRFLEACATALVLMSLILTVMPFSAKSWAMPPPMTPAPSTPADEIV